MNQIVLNRISRSIMKKSQRLLLSSGNTFQIPDLWAPSRFLSSTSTNVNLLFSELKLQDDKQQWLATNQNSSQHLFFVIPPSSIGTDSSSLSVLEQSQSSQKQLNTIEDTKIDDDDDPWLLAGKQTSISPKFKSWDSLECTEDGQILTSYITEVGDVIFNTVIGISEDFLGVANDDFILIDSDIFLSSLFALGLGRNSVLFTWNEQRQGFKQTIPKLRISGTTGDTLASLTTMFIECGNIVKSLQEFVDQSYSYETSPGRVALANSVSTLLTVLQVKLHNYSWKQSSVLQLQTIFRPVNSLLRCFQQIINNTATNRSDESLLSLIFEDIQILEHRTDYLRNILRQILTKVSQPWLNFASEWLGLQIETGLPLSIESKGKSLVRVESKTQISCQNIQCDKFDYFLDLDRIPSFIAPEDARTMFEVGKNLRLLKAHYPNHPLVKGDTISAINPPVLRWNFTCKDVDMVEIRALRYEDNFMTLLRKLARECPKNEVTSQMESHIRSGFSKKGLFERSTEDIQARILQSKYLFDQPLSSKVIHDDLSECLLQYLNNHQESEDDENYLFTPPISIVAALSFNPVIMAQARIVNGICMKFFFNSHQLQDHLSLQKDFQLFGNGVFASRLSHAIFDPELGGLNSSGVVGLRLDDRNSWPPASSELQVALVNILADCYFDRKSLSRNNNSENHLKKALPGDLSFAIRDMTKEEIDKCMNPNGLEALDFLHISYQPPAPLDAVITQSVLYKYDKLFKFLLRVIRMLYTVSSLYRNISVRAHHRRIRDQITQRFCIEAHHFICTISAYFFNTGISATWQIFEAKLNQIQMYIDEDDDRRLGQSEGLYKLRDYHEQVVDHIMFVLLLRKRQKSVLHLLEDIFRLVLDFSKLFRRRSQECPNHDYNDAIGKIYLNFKKNVDIFMTVLEGLSEKKNLDDMHQPNRSMSLVEDFCQENTVTELLLRLNFSGFYGKSIRDKNNVKK